MSNKISEQIIKDLAKMENRQRQIEYLAMCLEHRYKDGQTLVINSIRDHLNNNLKPNTL